MPFRGVPYAPVAEKDEDDVQLNSLAQTVQSRQQTRRRALSGCAKYLLLFWNILLILIIFILGSQVLKQNTNQCNPYPNPPSRIDHWQPSIKPTLFMNNTKYAYGTMWSSLAAVEAVLANWVPLSNKGRGLIKIDPKDRTNLDPPYILDPLNEGPEEAYMLSSLHQLHCLSTILHSYGKLRNGINESHMGENIAHCFDYLRQEIFCAGDVTLEGNASHRYPGVDIPWGAMHQCRDWEEVKTWADERIVWEFPDTLAIL